MRSEMLGEADSTYLEVGSSPEVGEGSAPGFSCQICLNEGDPGDPPAVLQCGQCNNFVCHRQCFAQYRDTVPETKCPLCRAVLDQLRLNTENHRKALLLFSCVSLGAILLFDVGLPATALSLTGDLLALKIGGPLVAFCGMWDLIQFLVVLHAVFGSEVRLPEWQGQSLTFVPGIEPTESPTDDYPALCKKMLGYLLLNADFVFAAVGWAAVFSLFFKWQGNLYWLIVLPYAWKALRAVLTLCGAALIVCTLLVQVLATGMVFLVGLSHRYEQSRIKGLRRREVQFFPRGGRHPQE
ncbi:MAG: RING finger protein [Sulfobacillus sp.]